MRKHTQECAWQFANGSGECDCVVSSVNVPFPEVNLGGARSEFTLVIVKPDPLPPVNPWTWRLNLPHWMLAGDGQDREFATAMRDFLRERGFDARLVAHTTLTDEVD